ncbi:MAG: thioesterase family protein [Gemmatimonadaceae bacterium]
MRFPLATRYADYDTKGHVNNAVYLTFFEMARHALWSDTWHRAADPPFIVGEARVKYTASARLGDPLAIDISVSEIRTKAWVFRYAIRDPRDERLVAEGETVQVMFDYGEGATVPIPDDVRRLLETLLT